MMANVDAECLIAMVEERPVLWDITQDLYKDKNETRAAWKDICIALKSDFEELNEEEKNEFGKSVIAKWNNLRDNWVRCYKKMREDKKASTPSGKVPRKYIFFDQMLFLRKVYQEKEAVSNNDLQSNPNDPATEKEAFSSSPTSNSNHSLSFITQPPVVLKGLQSQRCERKRKSDYFENKLLEILEKSREPPVMPDHHMSFFASLIPLLYQMSDEEILEFRMDVLTSIKRIRAQSTLP